MADKMITFLSQTTNSNHFLDDKIISSSEQDLILPFIIWRIPEEGQICCSTTFRRLNVFLLHDFLFKIFQLNFRKSWYFMILKSTFVFQLFHDYSDRKLWYLRLKESCLSRFCKFFILFKWVVMKKNTWPIHLKECNGQKFSAKNLTWDCWTKN